MSNANPEVSIGLPVFNGANYVAEAIESVLDQSHKNFELVICDNASTDNTHDMCSGYARNDSRVRYIRNETNIGAAKNYDLVWHKSRGKYFKWLAHDDRILPEYVEQTVSALKQDPSVVLCNSVVDYIDHNGDHLGYYRSVITRAAGDEPSERFAAIILRLHTCVDFFGMMPRSAMEGSLLHKAFRGSDRAFLAQMALRGRLLQLSEPLVQMRQHSEQYSQLRNTRQQVSWQDPSRSRRNELSILTLYRTYRELVNTESMTEMERKECRKVLRRFWVQGWTGARLLAELISIPFPGAASFFRDIAIKLNLSGAPKDFIR